MHRKTHSGRWGGGCGSPSAHISFSCTGHSVLLTHRHETSLQPQASRRSHACSQSNLQIAKDGDRSTNSIGGETQEVQERSKLGYAVCRKLSKDALSWSSRRWEVGSAKGLRQISSFRSIALVNLQAQMTISMTDAAKVRSRHGVAFEFLRKR